MTIVPFPDIYREPCPNCDGPQYDKWQRYFRGEDPEVAFGPCEECGQPPRCRCGCQTDRQCPQPASPDEMGYLICDWHWRERELLDEQNQYLDAEFHLRQWRELADELDRPVLMDITRWAEAEVKIKLAGIERELRELGLPE